MILYFSGTGNSRYAAQRMADALGEPLLSLNDRIKAGDTAPHRDRCAPRSSSRLPTRGASPASCEDWLLRTELARRAAGVVRHDLRQ